MILSKDTLIEGKIVKKGSDLKIVESLNNKLEIGLYKTSFIGDSNLFLEVEILGRTEKQVVFKVRGESITKKAKINMYEGEEYFYPLGRYSMAPTISASDKVK